MIKTASFSLWRSGSCEHKDYKQLGNAEPKSGFLKESTPTQTNPYMTDLFVLILVLSCYSSCNINVNKALLKISPTHILLKIITYIYIYIYIYIYVIVKLWPRVVYGIYTRYVSWFITIALACKCHRPEAIVQLACTMVFLWILSTCLLTSWSLRKLVVESEWLNKKSVSCCLEKNCCETQQKNSFIKKDVSVHCSSLHPIMASTKVQGGGCAWIMLTNDFLLTVFFRFPTGQKQQTHGIHFTIINLLFINYLAINKNQRS